jgi:uncharacterized radical SAM superfamily Fe-S cluster-containing enzyme
VGAEIHLRKACPRHGAFSAVIWRGRQDFAKWIDGAEKESCEDAPCPTECGLCEDHLQKTCCVLLEVTGRCDLRCRHCFADGGNSWEPSLRALKQSLKQLAEPGKTLVQLSGGEPTLRDDLPKVVAAARRAGCKHVQLNTNGIRLAREPSFVRALADAGLSFVFMQFDGTDDAVYRKLRGKPLFETKCKAIENCAAANLGVTLVPTLVPGVNTNRIARSCGSPCRALPTSAACTPARLLPRAHPPPRLATRRASRSTSSRPPSRSSRTDW